MKLFLIATCVLWAPVHGLIGYDCRGHSLNITSLSLVDIGDCEIEDIEPETQNTYVQLLQLSEFERTAAIQCRVEIDRTIYYCGMHSHVSVVQGGRREYIQEITVETCKRMHESGRLYLGRDVIIEGIKPNSTTSRGVHLAGTIGIDGRCSGAQYSDPYGTWDKVVVQAVIRMTLRNFEVNIQRSSGDIILPSGVHCKVPTGHCRDSHGEDTFWAVAPVDSCHFNEYDILYEGQASKLTPKQNQTLPTVYTVTTQDTTFALTRTKEFTLCGYTLLQTEHPKLFILETQRGNTFKIRSRIAVRNLDIFSYVNSKFIYVEKHIRTQLTQLYRDLMIQKCALEKQVLQNALSLYSIAPDEMAFRIMKSPGYTAVAAGEVIHLIKCVPVVCKFRHTQDCYNEMPVTYGNASAFLLPGSRIITYKAAARECNELVPPMYKIHETWYRLTPRLLESLAPPTIQPLVKPTWKYVSPSHLATSGIYSSEDLERLRDHIMFPVEKPSMLDTLARGAMGQTIPSGSISLTNFLDEKSLEKIAENTGARLWNGFMTFGSASAGVLAIILIARLVKLLVDTVIHGYALHTVYGWSIQLLGALWSSVTHLLLHLAKPRERASADPERGQPSESEGESHPLNPLSTPENQRPEPPRTCNGELLPTNELNKPLYYKELRTYLHDSPHRNV